MEKFFCNQNEENCCLSCFSSEEIFFGKAIWESFAVFLIVGVVVL